MIIYKFGKIEGDLKISLNSCEFKEFESVAVTSVRINVTFYLT